MPFWLKFGFNARQMFGFNARQMFATDMEFPSCPLCKRDIKCVLQVKCGECPVCYKGHADLEADNAMVVGVCCGGSFCESCLGKWVATCKAKAPKVLDVNEELLDAVRHLPSRFLKVHERKMVWKLNPDSDSYDLHFEDDDDGSEFPINGLSDTNCPIPSIVGYTAVYSLDEDCWMLLPLNHRLLVPPQKEVWVWWNNLLYWQDAETGWWSSQVDSYVCPIPPPSGFRAVYDDFFQEWDLIVI